MSGLLGDMPAVVDDAIASSQLRIKIELYAATGVVGGTTVVVVVSLDRRR